MDKESFRQLVMNTKDKLGEKGRELSDKYRERLQEFGASIIERLVALDQNSNGPSVLHFRTTHTAETIDEPQDVNLSEED